MKVVFVSFPSFNDFNKLSRAMAVVIEDLMVNVGLTSLDLVALDNKRLQDLLIQYSDLTRSYMSQNGLTLHPLNRHMSLDTELDPVDTALVVTIGIVRYAPYSRFVRRAAEDGIKVLEF